MFATLIVGLLGAGAAPPGPAPSLALYAPVPIEWQEPAETLSAYHRLMAEYEAAVKAYKEKVRSEKSPKARAEARKNHPAKEFFLRFDELVKTGDGRGLLWMIDTQRDRGVDKKEREGLKLNHYGRLVSDFAHADYLPGVLTQIANDKKVEPEQRVNLLKRVTANPKASPANRNEATYHTGAVLFGLEDSEKKEMGRQILEDLFAAHPDSEIGLRAKALVEKPDLSVGALAPDFSGQTIDGEKLKLSDYRGKVVLIDFFGFW